MKGRDRERKEGWKGIREGVWGTGEGNRGKGRERAVGNGWKGKEKGEGTGKREERGERERREGKEGGKGKGVGKCLSRFLSATLISAVRMSRRTSDMVWKIKYVIMHRR